MRIAFKDHAPEEDEVGAIGGAEAPESKSETSELLAVPPSKDPAYKLQGSQELLRVPGQGRGAGCQAVEGLFVVEKASAEGLRSLYETSG